MQNNFLSEKQQDIVALNTYPMYLRAAAGTGKTEVLIQKIINILENDKSSTLDNFSIITFTNKATDEIRFRLFDSLYSKWANNLHSDFNDSFIRTQAEIVNMINISTIHGFCESILRKYGLTIGIPLNFKVKSFRYESNKIISDVVSKYFDNSLLSDIPQYRICKLIDILLNSNSNSNHGIIIDEKKALQSYDLAVNDDFWKSFKKIYLSIYFETSKEVEKLKSELNILTPNDLISKTVTLLNDEYVKLKIANKYKYLFIDEFQDTNKDQFNFVNLLIDAGVNIFLVGDDKQSVYAFRGADIENSREMNNLISAHSRNASKVFLDENFRTDASLIKEINHIFNHQFMFSGRTLNFPIEPLAIPSIKKNTGEDYPLDILLEKNITEVIEYALNLKINGENANFGDIAILCRRNYDLDKIATLLKSKGYPIEVVGGKGFYKAKEIIDVYKLFNAVINKASQYQNELLFTDYYASINTNELSINFDNFLKELDVIFRKETVEEILSYIFEKSYIFDYYRKNNDYQAIGNLYKLKDLSRTLMNKNDMKPLQFLDYLHVMISTGQEEDEADTPQSDRANGVIRLFSIHKAKGLAFPIVIVPCIDNKLNRPVTKPKVIIDVKSDEFKLAFDNEIVKANAAPDKEYFSLLAEKTKEHLEEEIRIFYVACTRAKHRLILSSEKTETEINKTINWKDYASIAKWMYEIRQSGGIYG